MSRSRTARSICSVLDTHGDLACVTTTSGLGYKVPGRVGDSPIIGAGLYLDNTVGSCGSVGLGEVNLVNCASYLLIENLRNGMEPKDAIVALFKRIKEVTTRDPRFRDANGNPPGVNFYFVAKDGRVAAANMGDRSNSSCTTAIASAPSSRRRCSSDPDATRGSYAAASSGRARPGVRPRQGGSSCPQWARGGQERRVPGRQAVRSPRKRDERSGPTTHESGKRIRKYLEFSVTTMHSANLLGRF